MSLTVGDLGPDYSGARPAPAATYAAGGRFIIRYSAGAGNAAPNAQWKLCEVHEIRDALAAGLDFIANSEWYESRITEGAAAGKADGTADLGFWESRGLARGASIYVSWDQYPTESKWPAADAYLAAYNAALRGYYNVDCYAGTPYLRHALARGLIRYGWRTNAGSWSGDGLPYQPNTGTIPGRAAAVVVGGAKTPAHIWQTGNYWWNKGADENLILRLPVGSHLEALTPPPVPIPTPKPTPAPTPAPVPIPVHMEDDMAAILFHVTGKPDVYTNIWGGYDHVVDMAQYASIVKAFTAARVPLVHLETSQVQHANNLAQRAVA